MKPDSAIPVRLQRMLANSLALVPDEHARAELAAVTAAIAEVAWQQWIGNRAVEDNRVEHEFVVCDNFLRIAESERLSLSEKRVGAAFVFLHDSAFIHRITEVEIRAAVDDYSRARLLLQKQTQRQRHMAEGATNARRILTTLGVLNAGEMERCAELIAQHDVWKLGQPWPMSDDPLALACVEADALWPLHPLGVLADLERPTAGVLMGDVGDPAAWQRQVRQSLLTLQEFHANWLAFPQEQFCDGSIFRTAKGSELYRAWRDYWELSLEQL